MCQSSAESCGIKTIQLHSCISILRMKELRNLRESAEGRAFITTTFLYTFYVFFIHKKREVHFKTGIGSRME